MTGGAVAVRAEVADALTRPCELLVLKHAQISYGLDARLVSLARIESGRLPAPDAHALIGLDLLGGPKAALFLGVPGLESFGYRDIREFGHRALTVAHGVAPNVREICMTMHGAGFGLDETEAFESQLGGIAEAIAVNAAASKLEVVTFLDRDAGRVERMRRSLDRLFRGSLIPRGPGGRDRFSEPQAARLRSVGYDAGDKRRAFVAMPFAAEFDDLFHYGIEPSVRKAGFLCERIDKVAFTGDVVSMLKRRIDAAMFVVADVTGANANVYLEIGYAWGAGKPTVLVCAAGAERKFDIRGQRCLMYSSIRDLESKLAAELSTIYPEGAPL